MDKRVPEVVDIKDRLPEKKEEAAAGVSLEISAFRRVLKNRGFMALWLGQGISGVGDWVIVGVLLNQVNLMGGEMGLFYMMTFRFLPAFLFGLVAGAVVDRIDRKSLLIVCELARASLVLVLAFANSLVMICALVFGIECFTLLFGPARDSSIPDLVGPEELVTANSMMSTSTYLTMAIGTMIATVILGLAQLMYRYIPFLHFVRASDFQHRFAFVVDAMTFLASAFLISTIAFPRRRGRRAEFSFQHVKTDLVEGFHFMTGDPLTRSILGVMIIGFIGGGSLYILGAPFAEQVLSSVGSKFTLILTMLLVGVVVGAAVAPWLSKTLSMEKWFGRGVVAFGTTMMVFSIIDFYALSLIVISIGGVFLGYMLVTAYTLLQRHLEPEIRGRVFAAMQTIMRTCLLLSMGMFALVARLFRYWIPWTAEKPVFRSLNLGFMSKSVYPSMLALMVGGAIVVVGGFYSIRSMRHYVRSREEGGRVERIDAAT